MPISAPSVPGKKTKAPTRKRGSASERVLSLRDLAQLAGVDVSTASRSLRDDPQISRERASEIKALAEKIGYRPRPMRGKRTQAIGLLLVTANSTTPADQHLQRILWMVERAVTEKGLHMNLEFVSPDEGNATLPSIVARNRVDGVLLAGHPPVRLVELIRETGMPMAAFNEKIERLRLSCLRSQPAAVLREAVSRLAAWGHRRIGTVLTHMRYPAMQDRYQAYVDALAYVNIAVDPALVVDGLPDDIQGGREGVRVLAERGKLPSAILFGNDWMALGGIYELARSGLRVPEDVSVAGSGNYPICDHLEPGITSIAADEPQVGRDALQLLVEQIEGGGKAELREASIPQFVVWRESTGPLVTKT
ncbi:MAG: LacI family transcriptional regulator [Opitutaceae bacterium]|jgi:LacI family transcriptional regulator|nr:LacI family transcriptional regulator [Opitutaceae bacterium]